MNIFIVIEEDIDGARVAYTSSERGKAELYVQENYARELRWLMDNVWRCGSSIVSIQESTLDA